MRKLFALISILLLAFTLAKAQEQEGIETIIVGTVLDEITGDPIVNANVYYKGTNIGCATNEEGMFMVRTYLKKTQWLYITAVGYRSEKYKIEPGQYGGIESRMRQESTLLNDILIRPDNAQAAMLIRQAAIHRPQNDITLSSDYSYLVRRSELLSLSGIDRHHLQRMIWRNLKKGMIEAPDSTMQLPLYTLKGNYQIKGTNISAASEIDTHTAVLTKEDFSVYLNDIPEQINFYHNTISLLGKSFISPLSSIGNNYYIYYLADSVCKADSKEYTIHFRSKNNYIPSFNGELKIDSATFALRSIEAGASRKTNINYLSSVQISQQFDASNRLQDEQVSLLFDVAVSIDSTRTFPTLLIERQQTCIDSTAIVNNFDISISDNAIDSLQDIPLVKTAKWIAHIINTGNISTGTFVEIGNIADIFGYSNHEGIRLGLPLTTNERMSDIVQLNAFVGYGFKDYALKGSGEIKIKIPNERRHIISAGYSDRYVRTEASTIDYEIRENSIFHADQDFTHLIFSPLHYQESASTFTRRKLAHIKMENEWTDVVETSLNINIGNIGYGDPLVGWNNIPTFRYSSVEAMMRLGWHEKKINMFMRQYHAHSQYPVIHILAEGGGYRTAEMEQDELYAKLTLMIQQHIALGMAGRIDYMAQAGVVFGNVPYPLLEHFDANIGYTYDPYRFTLMNNYQYGADLFLQCHVNWNGEGVVFNRIPWVQRLQLRELAEVKLAWGSLRPTHNKIIELPTTLKAPTIPYIEAGIGIGNILRIGEVYAVFRLTNFSDTTTPWWGIRARLHLGL